jgi:hypothetical protein
MAPGMRIVFIAVALLAATAGAAQTRGFVWTAGEAPGEAELRFASPDGARQAFRLACDSRGTRIAVFVRGTPRNLPADSETFESRIQLFLGRTEYSLGGTGTRLADGNSRVEALMREPVSAFFDAMARQGRLTVVHFAGRTKAPAPDEALVSGFRAACSALR